MDDLCICCGRTVRPRQEALCCDGCNKWQHRTCDTGISREMYRLAVRSKHNIDWRCNNCTVLTVSINVPLMFIVL